MSSIESRLAKLESVLGPETVDAWSDYDPAVRTSLASFALDAGSRACTSTGGGRHSGPSPDSECVAAVGRAVDQLTARLKTEGLLLPSLCDRRRELVRQIAREMTAALPSFRDGVDHGPSDD